MLFFQPLDQCVLCVLPCRRIQVIDDEHDDPLLAALRINKTSEGLYSFQRTGLEMCVAGDLAILETLLDCTVHAQDRRGARD